MATRGIVSGNLLIFDGKCFNDWCVKMDAILSFQGVEEIVQKGCREPLKNAKEEKARKTLDCKARMLIHQCVSTNIFQKISKANTTKEAWDILSVGYGKARNCC